MKDTRTVAAIRAVPDRRRAVAARRTLAVLIVVAGTVGTAGIGFAAGATGTAAQPTDTIVASSAPAAGSARAFDPTTVHEIAVTFDQADYDAAIEAYVERDDKEWIEVTVMIDGTTYERAGMRLKGNSSLRGLGRGVQPGATTAPETLPWLIRLDRNIDGQTHDGHADFVIRSNNTQTSLNEALALTLLDRAGLASQRAVPAAVSMNGSDPILRLVVEHPNDRAWYEASFDGDGALYKAESTGDWTYRGDDQDAYDDVFDQESGDDLTDLAPLIEFLDFLNNSDDAAFAAELPERLDVDGFATYLAMMELIGNTDDVDGPGNNAYLWWDAATGRFTVVPWDMNLAFGGFPGGGRGGPGGGLPGGVPGGRDDSSSGPSGGSVAAGTPGSGASGDVFPVDLPGGSLPEGMLPDGAFPGGPLPEEFPADGLPGGRRGGGDFTGGPLGRQANPLVERFHANAEFEAVYQQRLGELRAALFDSGVASEILDDWVATLSTQAAELVALDTITTEADAIRSQLTV